MSKVSVLLTFLYMSNTKNSELEYVIDISHYGDLVIALSINPQP